MASLSSSADIYIYAIEPWIAGLYQIVKYVLDPDLPGTVWVDDKDILTRLIIPIPCSD